MALLPSIKDIKAAVVAELLSIGPSIGKVVNGRRDITDVKIFEDTYFDSVSSTIRAWIVDWDGSNSREDEAGCLFIVPRAISIEGYLVKNQEGGSADTWDDLVDVVFSKLNGNVPIFGDAPLEEDVGHNATSDEQMFGGFLCHHVRIDLLIESEETK